MDDAIINQYRIDIHESTLKIENEEKMFKLVRQEKLFDLSDRRGLARGFHQVLCLTSNGPTLNIN